MGFIYCIRNKKNNRKYYGSTAGELEFRLRNHRNWLRSGKHKNKRLQDAWNEDGEDNFEFICVEDNASDDILLCIEGNYIRENGTLNKEYGYNIAMPQCAGGFRHSQETKDILSEGKIGDKNPMFGKTGALHPNYGKPVTEDAKQKMREAKIGYVPSEDQRKKQSDALKGHVKTPEHCKNLSKSLTGKKKSPEAINNRMVSYCTERYFVVSPDGGRWYARNLRDLCKTISLNHRTAYNILHEKYKTNKKGWVVRYATDIEKERYEDRIGDKPWIAV